MSKLIVSIILSFVFIFLGSAYIADANVIIWPDGRGPDGGFDPRTPPPLFPIPPFIVLLPAIFLLILISVFGIDKKLKAHKGMLVGFVYFLFIVILNFIELKFFPLNTPPLFKTLVFFAFGTPAILGLVFRPRLSGKQYIPYIIFSFLSVLLFSILYVVIISSEGRISMGFFPWLFQKSNTNVISGFLKLGAILGISSIIYPTIRALLSLKNLKDNSIN